MKAETEETVQMEVAAVPAPEEIKRERRKGLFMQIEEYLATDEGKELVFFNCKMHENTTTGYIVCNDERFDHFLNNRFRSKNIEQRHKKIKGSLARLVIIKCGADLSEEKPKNDEGIAEAIQNMKNWPAVEKVKECFNAEFKTIKSTKSMHTIGVFVDGEKKIELSGKGNAKATKAATEHKAAVQFLNLEEFTTKYIDSFEIPPTPETSKPGHSGRPAGQSKDNLQKYCETLGINAPVYEETEGTWNCKIVISTEGKADENECAADVFNQLKAIQRKKDPRNPEEGKKRKNTDKSNTKPEKIQKISDNNGCSATEDNGELGPVLDGVAGITNIVSKLNYLSQLTRTTLNWTFTPNAGPDGKAFECSVIHGDTTATGQAANKKEAKQQASTTMVKMLAPQYNWEELKGNKKSTK